MPQPTRFHPIIYVRGYAMSRAEQDETTADPFCGFNLGSTVSRAVPDKNAPARKFVFESPLVRLGSDFGYADVYRDGLDIVDADWEGAIPYRSVVIYRYYEPGSALLGNAKPRSIEEFANGLSDLILRVKALACADPVNKVAPGDFRCHLVAHSMGGLVCRAFLQNRALGRDEARRCVDKFFTYATPHNGIDLAGVNVPEWLPLGDLDNFNRKRMAEYLDLGAAFKKTQRVDWLPDDRFPAERVFCMIGTNRGDYEVAHGLSRTFAGHGSDGLVRVENASVWSLDRRTFASVPCATAYTFRAHSGFFGIVNSEESYQNLTRFLFGDVRVDMWADVDEVRLPKELEGKNVEALYQFEVTAAPRGKRWYLTRRTAEEDSVACRKHTDLAATTAGDARSIYLSTLFLSDWARVDPTRPSLACTLDFGVRAPDYEVERRFWPDRHYEGAYLFRDALTLEVVHPGNGGSGWKAKYDWQSRKAGQATKILTPEERGDSHIELDIPFDSKSSPGLAGRLRLLVSMWNA
jgi:hypothetical protein